MPTNLVEREGRGEGLFLGFCTGKGGTKLYANLLHFRNRGRRSTLFRRFGKSFVLLIRSVSLLCKLRFIASLLLHNSQG